MQTTKIAAKNQEITIYLYWQMLRELEGKAGDNILTKHLVEASYRHWNTITGGGPLSGDKETCYWCFGTGKVTDTSHITEPKPEIPIELVNHMKDAFQDWLRDKAVIDREDEFNPVAGI